jgi:hypothetical protein
MKEERCIYIRAGYSTVTAQNSHVAVLALPPRAARQQIGQIQGTLTKGEDSVRLPSSLR